MIKRNNYKFQFTVLFLLVIGIFLMRKCEIEKVPRPQFTIALKESIYVEYGVDLYNEQPLINIIESHVIEEIYSSIPVHARYEFEIDNSKESFDFYDRAKTLKWDEEGRTLYANVKSVGAILGFHHMVGNSKAGMEVLTKEYKELNLPKVEPFEGNFTITIDNYSETYTFNYYVIKVF